MSGIASPDPQTEVRLQRIEDTQPRIEALLRSVDERLRRVEIDLAEIKGRAAHLPSTWAMITTMFGGQVAFAAVIFAIVRFASGH